MLAICVIAVWGAAYFTAAPGQSLSVFWGMVQYVKNPSQELVVASNKTELNKTKDFEVHANLKWQDTEIAITNGEMFQIDSAGVWNARVKTGVHDASGIKGEPRDYQIPGVNLGALVAKIGTAGNVFYVGERYRGVAKESGHLFLGIQDKYEYDGKGGLSDNSGEIRVTVSK